MISLAESDDLSLYDHSRAKLRDRRVGRLRVTTDNHGDRPGFWWRFHYFSHELGRFTTGEKHRPDITTVAEAVALVEEFVAFFRGGDTFIHETDCAWLSAMFSTIASQLSAGNLSGARVEGEYSYAWRLVEAPR